MKISTSQFRNGLKIIINDQPCSILEHEFHKPGKGQAVMRVKFRNLITGKVIDKTYKSGESVEEADVMTAEMSYLYSDGEQWHFMNSSTYEQIAINADVVGDARKWIIGQENCEVVIWNDEPISVEAPPFVELTLQNQTLVLRETLSLAQQNLLNWKLELPSKFPCLSKREKK